MIHKLNEPEKGIEYLKELIARPVSDPSLLVYAKEELNLIESNLKRTTAGIKPKNSRQMHGHPPNRGAN